MAPRWFEQTRDLNKILQELWHTKGFNVRRSKSLLWRDRAEEHTLARHEESGDSKMMDSSQQVRAVKCIKMCELPGKME